MRETKTFPRKIQFYTAETAMMEIGCCKRTIYRLVQRLKIQTVHFGRKHFFLPEHIEILRKAFIATSRTKLPHLPVREKHPLHPQFWSVNHAATEAGCTTEEFWRAAERLKIKPVDLKTGLYFLTRHVEAVKQEFEKDKH
jgi:hypothetical protein